MKAFQDQYGMVINEGSDRSTFTKGKSVSRCNRPFSNLLFSSLSLSLISSPHTLQHYLLEVQDYLENSCDPELESPAKRNTTD